jgi:hypothetical protein
MKKSKITPNNNTAIGKFIKGSLYIADNTVALCTETNTCLKGVCIYDEDIPSNVGDYSDKWAKEMFTKFTGTITLED